MKLIDIFKDKMKTASDNIDTCEEEYKIKEITYIKVTMTEEVKRRKKQEELKKLYNINLKSEKAL